MRFAKLVFLLARIYGLVVLTPLYFLEGTIGRRQPPVTHPEYFYGFVGVGLAWQVLFLVLASDPVRYRPMMVPSILEKISYGIALICLFAARRIPFVVVGIGSMDWIFAALFAASYWVTRPGRVELRSSTEGRG